MNKNPYSILNISEDATYQEIKDSYLHLSRNLHPDKQPLQNYHMAKEHFQTIDKAYKSIASPLRRFIFKEFGLKGIGLIDEFPLQFKHFEQEGLNIQDKEVQKKVKHLIIYMLHEQHAISETDKSKLATKSIVNLSKLLKQSKYFNTTRKVPEIQKNSFNYEMPLPDFYGFSNSFGLSQQAGGLQKATTSTLDFNFTTMKRIRNNVLIHAQLSTDNQATSFDLNADWIISNSMQLRFSPLSVSNGQFSLPKIGVDKVFNDFSFSGITDFQHINVDVSDLNSQRGGKNKLSKSIKIMLQKNGVMVVPKLQYDLTSDLKIIFQVMCSLQEQNTLNFGLNYGYKLKLSEEYKLELMSFTGAQNYFQVSLYSPKFRVNIPLLSEGDAVKLESYKLVAFILAYALIKGYKYVDMKNHMNRKKIIHQQYNRLSEQKLSITKAVNEVSALANELLQKQIKHNGLVIVKAFLGEFKFIKKIYNAISNLNIVQGNTIQQKYESLKQALENKLAAQNIKYGNIQDELFDISDLFRSFVRGSQIINKKIHNFHPLISEQTVPYVLVIYLNRGKLGIFFDENSKNINIGGLKEQKANIFKRAKHLIVDWLW